MHEFICGVSAFRLLRTPPQVLALYPPLPDISTRVGKLAIARNPEALGGLGIPIHVLVTQRKYLRYSSSVKMHLWSQELPLGSFFENDLKITLSSPLFTLLTMAPHVSVTHLAMAMYELCGSFSVYRPAPESQAHLDAMRNTRLSRNMWQQVRDAHGNGTSLWKRPPLITVHELQHYAEHINGLRGSKQFRQAVQMVTGQTASPLEAQASMLLGASRRLGGAGLAPFENNHLVRLGRKARRLAGRQHCYCDLFFPGCKGGRALDVECHGHLVHDSAEQGGLDANRTLALQSMGIDVIFLTYEQLVDEERRHVAIDHIARRAGFRPRPKTEALMQKERALCEELFIDWETLGS